MKKYKPVIIIMLLVKFSSITNAQVSAQQQVMQAMQQLAEAYKKNDRLAFDITYRYAAEEAPAVYLDSLAGHFKMNGNRYWYELDNTESVATADYMIMLFKEDKIMYLAPVSPHRGDQGGPPASSISTSPVDQLVLMDSFFVNNKNITCQMTEVGKLQMITIQFNEPVVYKRIEYHINKVSGYLTKMISVVKASQLYDAAVRSQIEGPVTWAVVEAVYSNYRQTTGDATLFNSNRYFRKEGKEFITVAPYEAYKIFLGKPGM